MDFSSAINERMRDVADCSTEPFIIYRDGKGEWHNDYTRSTYGEPLGLVNEAKAQDPLSREYIGKDFSKGSFPSVCDDVFRDRLRAEYDIHRSSGRDSGNLHAITCFVIDNVSALSPETMDYLTSIDRPLRALNEMCPLIVDTLDAGVSYSEAATTDAISYIEGAVHSRMNGIDASMGKTVLMSVGNTVNPSEYTPTMSVTLGGWRTTLAENPDKPESYLVEWRRYPDKGISDDNYFCGVTSNYLEAICEYLKHCQFCVNVVQSIRETNKNLYGIEYTTLTADDCLPDSKNDDFTGKLVVVKAVMLLPECRTSENQLVLCSHGNGARPDAIGTSVFGKELLSGESVCYGRHQIAGIADPSKLPAWATEKLAQMESEKPQEQKSKQEPKLDSPTEQGATPVGKPKPAKSKKPSLYGRLNKAIAEAAVYNAGNKSMQKLKKRGDMEV